MTTHCIWSHQHPPFHFWSPWFFCAEQQHCPRTAWSMIFSSFWADPNRHAWNGASSSSPCVRWNSSALALNFWTWSWQTWRRCGSKMIQIPTQPLALAQPTAPPARPEWSAPPLGQFLASVASWEGRIIGRSRICRQLWANRSQSPGNSAVEHMEDNKSLIKMGQFSKILRSPLYTCMLNR